jgi:hypothetical protein
MTFNTLAVVNSLNVVKFKKRWHVEKNQIQKTWVKLEYGKRMWCIRVKIDCFYGKELLLVKILINYKSLK